MINGIGKEFPSGVKWYTSGIAHVPVYFPEGVVRCQYCPFCRAEKELERYWCRLNNEMIYDPFTGIGTYCPIEFDDGINRGISGDENSGFPSDN